MASIEPVKECKRIHWVLWAEQTQDHKGTSEGEKEREGGNNRNTLISLS